MDKRIEIKCVCENGKGKRYENVVQVENLLLASRFINAFEPKRGYKVVAWNLQEVEVLL